MSGLSPAIGSSNREFRCKLAVWRLAAIETSQGSHHHCLEYVGDGVGLRNLGRIVRLPGAGGRWLWSRFVAAWLRMMGVSVGAKCTFWGIPRVRKSPHSTIQIGSGVAIRSGSRSNPFSRGLPTVLSTVAPGAAILIGDSARLSDCVIVSATQVLLGDHTYVGVEALITDTDAHPACASCRECRERAATKPVVVGPGCFIGARSVLLKGTQLAEHTCVGAGSVVQGRAAPLEGIVGGNPARQLRQTAACDRHQVLAESPSQC